ncbi:hypothetical protein K7X08_009968 [Anisodus acutangulus]|uniref:Uncharacterized protein n=1 Tax=Anisodus acutangulus TaxID=402998 RepID=A0A9Q1RU30_9SOLA|nr:hypothetical protein K7X08_009968 [Anisodus acutangulus]
MNDVPQSEERTTNVPKDSELPEVNTTKEIVRKRKKEEIALRFADPSSKELYLAGLEIKREGNLSWVIHEEKRMSWNGLKNECPVIIQNLKASSPRGPAPTKKTAPATFVATSSAPDEGQGIPAHGMRLIRLVEVKVMQLIEEFPTYVKEATETTLTPYKENLEALFSTHSRVSTKPRVDHSTERDDMEEDQDIEDDDDNRSERQSDSELDIDKGDDPLTSAHLTVRATNIPLEEVDTVIAM